MSPYRRNPLRLIVNRETQLRILRWVGGAVFLGMLTAVVLTLAWDQWLWTLVLLIVSGSLISLWVSRRISGPLTRIEKDLEMILTGAVNRHPIHLREGDALGHLVDLINKLLGQTGHPHG